MKCLVKQAFTATTPDREIALKPKQEIEVEEKLGLDLINRGLVSPLEGEAWLIYSEILQDFLWAVRDEEARERLLAEGVKEAIYTEAEIDLLRGVSKKTLKTVHEAKKVFQGSNVHEIIKKEDSYDERPLPSR